MPRISPIPRRRCRPRTCIQCGCTDLRACKGGCQWLLKHPKTNTGVCSECYQLALNSLAIAINESDEPNYCDISWFGPMITKAESEKW
jgi:hypothetical protein